MTHYIDLQAARRLAAQIVHADQHLHRTGWPQNPSGETALRARALGEFLEVLADELKAAGLYDNGQVPADGQMLSGLRFTIDELISSTVLGSPDQRA